MVSPLLLALAVVLVVPELAASGWRAGSAGMGAGPPHLVCMRLCRRRNSLMRYLTLLFLVLSAPPPSCFLAADPVLDDRRLGLVVPAPHSAPPSPPLWLLLPTMCPVVPPPDGCLLPPRVLIRGPHRTERFHPW